MIYTEDKFRPLPQYPTYPPYHKGEYLEDYFYKKFQEENPKVSRNYIGISWTTLYCDNKRNGLQDYLNTLPRDGKYFTVSQHDDAPIENLPTDTLCFSAGGNIRNTNTIPIPLVCSRLNQNIDIPEEKPLLASFVGSGTHPIRIKMFESCKNDGDIFMQIKGWNPKVDENDFNTFLKATVNSKFCLCPRGYGLNSFRLYEAMQLGSIPVIITNIPYLPWKDELDWSEFSVLVLPDQIDSIPQILRNYSDEKIKQMKNKITQFYESYFTLEGVFNQILRRL